MKGRTRRSSNVDVDKTSTNKKRKSTVETNNRHTSDNRKSRRDQNAIPTNPKRMDVTNRGSDNSMGGKHNDNISDVQSIEYSSDDSDFSKKSKDVCELSQHESLQKIMDTMMEMKESYNNMANKFESIVNLREEFDEMKGLFRTFHKQGTSPLQSSFIRVEERRSISDISCSHNTVAYFKKERKNIEKQLKQVIVQDTFARAKFLIDRPKQEEGEEEEETPTEAEKVVLKAIEMKQVNVPVGVNKDEYVKNAAELVKKQYNIIRSQVQQNLRKRWLGKLRSFRCIVYYFCFYSNQAYVVVLLT